MSGRSSPEPAASAELVRYEALVARALTSDDPAAAFDAIASDASLGPRLCALVAGADRVGVRLAAMLVAKLRFERLVQGSISARRAFEADPGAFTHLFRRYHRAVPPTALHSVAEAADFERWLAREAGEPGP